MSAKEMFEKLGYRRNEQIYFQNATIEDMDKRFIDYQKNKVHIILSSFGVPAICKFEVGMFYRNKVQDITLEELQAINKQIEELGWNKWKIN